MLAQTPSFSKTVHGIFLGFIFWLISGHTHSYQQANTKIIFLQIYSCRNLINCVASKASHKGQLSHLVQVFENRVCAVEFSYERCRHFLARLNRVWALSPPVPFCPLKRHRLNFKWCKAEKAALQR